MPVRTHGITYCMGNQNVGHVLILIVGESPFANREGMRKTKIFSRINYVKEKGVLLQIRKKKKTYLQISLDPEYMIVIENKEEIGTDLDLPCG